MLEDASECDLALSDLDVQVIFTLKSIVNFCQCERKNKLSEAYMSCHHFDRRRRCPACPLFTTVFVGVGITFCDECVNISRITYF